MSLEDLVKELIVKLDRGLTLDWTDIRIYLVFILSSFIGGIIGSYATKYFSKRGEIDAIKKDVSSSC